jgi:hypothetical protein
MARRKAEKARCLATGEPGRVLLQISLSTEAASELADFLAQAADRLAGAVDEANRELPSSLGARR